MTSVAKIRTSLIAALAIALFAAWYWLDAKPERDFMSRVQQEIGKGTQELDLARLMPGKWETVCGSHGYDGPMQLKKYGRTYPAAGAAQDGAWGLVFIDADGSHESVAGSIKDGFSFDFGCLDREHAKLVRKAGNETEWVARRNSGM